VNIRLKMQSINKFVGMLVRRGMRGEMSGRSYEEDRN
jgi:hypothetical protein